MTELPKAIEASDHNSEVPKVKAKTPKKGSSNNVFVDIIVCMLIPTLILKKLSGDDMLGPNLALITALSLPLMLGIWGFVKDRKISFVPALGFISILLTGGIGILKLPKEYIAYKEALIPGIFAIVAILSTFTKHPLIRTFVYNDILIDTEKVSQRLNELNKQSEFDKIMVKSTLILSSSFVFSSIANYILAKWIVVSESGTDAFNSELGTMNLYTYPIIVAPMMIISIISLYYVITNIMRITGFKLEELFHSEDEEIPLD